MHRWTPDRGWCQGHKRRFWQGCSTVWGGRAKARHTQHCVQVVPGAKHDSGIKMLNAWWHLIVGGRENAWWFVKAELWPLRFQNKDIFAISPPPPPRPQIISWFDGRKFMATPLRTLWLCLRCIYNWFFPKFPLENILCSNNYSSQHRSTIAVEMTFFF